MPGNLTRLRASEDFVPQIHSVKCQLCICVCGCSRNISSKPRCRFNELNMHLQEYICYWSLGNFKRTFHAYNCFFFGGGTYRLRLIGRSLELGY